MKSLTQFVEHMTDKAYVKNPKRYQEIEDQSKKLAEDVVKTMQDYCENDTQVQDFLFGLIKDIWFEMPKGSRRKNFLTVLKDFVDQE